MTEPTTTRTPARIVLAFMLVVASAGIAITDILLTHNMEPSIVGNFLHVPNRIVEIFAWVLIAGLALFRNRFSRIVLLVMTMATASVFFGARPYPLDPSREALATTLEFGLRLAACGLLFTRRADAWFARMHEQQPKRRSLPRTLYVLGSSILVVVAMSLALTLDATRLGLQNAIFGLILWGVAVAVAVAYMMMPRVGWPAKLTSLMIAVAAPVIARLLDPLLAPIAALFG